MTVRSTISVLSVALLKFYLLGPVSSNHIKLYIMLHARVNRHYMVIDAEVVRLGKAE